ncbi:hypothetical protein ACFV4M_41135 [Kitasatospora indigofera]
MTCGQRSVRAQFAPSGAFVVALVSGPDEHSRQLAMPQVLDILEVRGARLPPR